MKLRIVFLCLFIVPFLRSAGLNSQIILQLEIYKEIQALKFYTGDEIHFKATQFPKEWQKKKVERLLVEDGIILFEDGLVNLKDITHFRVYKPTVRAIGQKLMQFGAVWWVFGGIIHLTTPNQFTWGTFAIGATAVGIGWLLKKFVSRRTFKIKKSANLRILDISFPTKEQWFKSGNIP